MDMYNAIKDSAGQFVFIPKIRGKLKKKYKKFVVLGMGGSNHATDLIKMYNPELDIIVHRNYGLPVLKDIKERLIIASSYSGNTEEVLDGFDLARKKKLALAAVSVGGKLLTRAKKYGVPYIQMPNTGIQPRSATGFSFKSLLKIMGQNTAPVSSLVLKPMAYEQAGRALAKKIKGRVPIVYSSTKNWALVNNWKIRLNETGKIPAFGNVLPELNHNEMNGFDVSKKLSKGFYFIFLKDKNDHPKVIKRMEVLKKLYIKRGLPVEVVLLKGKDPLFRMFSNLVLADWTAYYTAVQYGADPDQVPMVEEFKRILAR